MFASVEKTVTNTKTSENKRAMPDVKELALLQCDDNRCLSPCLTKVFWPSLIYTVLALVKLLLYLIKTSNYYQPSYCSPEVLCKL